MFKKLVIGIAVVIGLFLVVVATRPNDFKVERSATVAATPAEVFAQVNDFHAWEAWSPWAKLDPNAKNTFEGPASGEGAIFRWVGNSQVGKGSMTLVESKPNESIRIRLDFVEPFEGTNQTLFTFKPIESGTELTWTMTGHHNFVGKAMCLIMNGEKMIGDQFEKGLASIKQVVEKK